MLAMTPHRGASGAYPVDLGSRRMATIY